jgi:hypothetical protein
MIINYRVQVKIRAEAQLPKCIKKCANQNKKCSFSYNLKSNTLAKISFVAVKLPCNSILVFLVWFVIEFFQTKLR